jgi:hypothetical protein
MPKFLVLLVLIVSLFCFTCSSPRVANDNPLYDDLSFIDNLNNFKESLGRAGFSVQEGKLVYLDVIELYNRGLLQDCAGNNPSSPYLTYMLPRLAGQSVNELRTDALINPSHKGLYFGTRLRPDEAVIYIGLTPPKCSYFSYRSYLLSRYYPELGSFKMIIANLGDTINNMTIKTETVDSERFDSETIIISTADKKTFNRINKAIESSGLSTDIINLDVIPSSIVKMGLDEKSDTIGWLNRVALFHDKNRGESFLKNPAAVILRVTPVAVQEHDPLPIPELRRRGVGTTEAELQEGLDKLGDAIVKKHESLFAQELAIHYRDTEITKAITDGVRISGNNRDTTYLYTDQFKLENEEDDFVIVYGVNHVMTEKATYANFSVYGVDAWNGIGAVDNNQFQGTAKNYIPDHPKAGYYYVWKIERRCLTDSNCFQVLRGRKGYGIELNDQVMIAFRAYLEPATKVGPLYEELLKDRAIKFSKIPGTN